MWVSGIRRVLYWWDSGQEKYVTVVSLAVIRRGKGRIPNDAQFSLSTVLVESLSLTGLHAVGFMECLM